MRTALNYFLEKEIEQEAKPAQIEAETKVGRASRNGHTVSSSPSHPSRCNMLPLDTRLILLGGTLVDAAPAVVIGYAVITAFLSIMRLQGSDAARLLIAKGVLSALGFSVAGSLLKIIALET